jgi:putative FmdB family regulatory protein
MPLYEYECDDCGERFEMIRKFSDPPLEECRSCGKGPVTKLVSSPAIQFKGEGWYVTDYAGRGKPDANSVEKTSPKSDNKSTDKSAESKGADGKAGDKKDAAKPDGVPKSGGDAKKESSAPVKGDSNSKKP